MKKIGVLVVVLLLVFIWWFIGTTKEINLQGEEVTFDYSGIHGTISIEAISGNYSYQFTMKALGAFSGYFSGNSLSFTHDYSYENGRSVSLVQAKDGTVGAVATIGGRMEVSEQFSTTGEGSLLSVHIVIEAESENVNKVVEPPPPPPMPIIVSGYLRDDKGNIIGGYFENKGNASFRGKISFKVGLSYNQGWIAESVSQYLRGSSCLIVLNPKERVEFLVVPTPGAYTFVFPSIIQNDLPISFSVTPPPADAPVIETFKDMIYNWWTEYVDPEPDVDYVNTRVLLDDKALGFYFPIQPYFEPPR